MSSGANNTDSTPHATPMATPRQIASSGYPKVPSPVRIEHDLMQDETMDEPGTPPRAVAGTQLPPQTPSNNNKRVRKGLPTTAGTSMGGNTHNAEGSVEAVETPVSPAAAASDIIDLPPLALALALTPTLDTAASTTAEAVPQPAHAAPMLAADPALTTLAPGLGNGATRIIPPPGHGATANATDTPAPPPPPAITLPPRLQGVTKDDIFKNINRTMLAQWEAIPGIKVIIVPYNPGYAPDRVMAINTRLRSAIMAALHLVTLPPLGPPAPEKPTHPHATNAPPYGFMLGPVSAEEEQLLTARQVWSTETISFFALPWNPSPGTFVGTITGLTYDTDATGIGAITQKLKNLILASVPILQLVEERHDAIPNYIDPAMGLASLLNTMQVRPWDDEGYVRWNIYIDPPTHHVTYHARWRNLVMGCQIISAYHGASIPFNTLARCRGCRSIDHVDQNCPYPKMISWKTPLAEESTRGRGRGRGRGRSHGW